jgi:hypothetical protein
MYFQLIRIHHRFYMPYSDIHRNVLVQTPVTPGRMVFECELNFAIMPFKVITLALVHCVDLRTLLFIIKSSSLPITSAVPDRLSIKDTDCDPGKFVVAWATSV